MVESIEAAPVEAGTAKAEIRSAGIRTRVKVPLRFGDGYTTDADVYTFTGLIDGEEHVALGLGDYRNAEAPLVRLHSECLTGDVFGSARCDCGPQLRDSVEQIAKAGGFLLYLRQEGRGIGLYNKLDAYALQDQGLDTYAANIALGLPSDARDYEPAAQMLRALEHTEIDLLSNNPDKARQLTNYGITVNRMVSTGVFVNPTNRRYLQAKVDITGHRIALSAA